MAILSERFARFAGVHLRTQPDRRVYAALAGTPARTWPVGELAAHAQVSHREADAAVRRFVAAGIAERLEPDRHRRYRWSSTMSYLTAADGLDVAVDPVCGMPVDDAMTHAVEHDGVTVRFCSLPCVVLWRSSHHRELGR